MSLLRGSVTYKIINSILRVIESARDPSTEARMAAIRGCLFRTARTTAALVAGALLLGLTTSATAANPTAALSASVASRPTVTAVTPGSGDPAQTEYVTITGTGFTSASTVTFGSVPGMKTVVVSSTHIDVVPPAHHVLGAFYVHVINAAGTSAATPGSRFTFVRPPVQLSVSTHVLGTPTGMSCPTTTFCLIVDEGGRSFSFDGTTTVAAGPTRLTSAVVRPVIVSCAYATFCAATDGAHVTTYDGTRWTEPRTFPNGFLALSLSCPTGTFCVAGGDDGHWFRFHAGSWHGAQLGSTTADLRSVSCVSPSFCLAVDSAGETWRWDGRGWFEQGSSEGVQALESVSCVNPTVCVAVGNSRGPSPVGQSRLYNGTAWSAPQQISPADFFHSQVSCVTGPVCVALANDGTEADYYNGSTWTTTTLPAMAKPVAISCASAGQCRMVDDVGQVSTFNGATWGPQISVDPALHQIDAISCAPTRCVALDHSGAAIDIDDLADLAASTTAQIDNLGAPVAISCPTSSFCTAVDDAGNVITFNGSVWSTPSVIDPNGGLTSVSCPNPDFCMAVDDTGRVLAYSDSRWHAPRQLVTSGGLSSISCSSTRFCTAVGRGDYAVRYTGSWQPARKIDTERRQGEKDELTSVSCSSPKFCLVGTDEQGVRTWNGGAWSRHQPLPVDSDNDLPNGGQVYGVSCPTVRFCGVAFDELNGLNVVTMNGAAQTLQDLSLDSSLTISCWAPGECAAAGANTIATLGG
jgi:hypothetical protein